MENERSHHLLYIRNVDLSWLATMEFLSQFHPNKLARPVKYPLLCINFTMGRLGQFSITCICLAISYWLSLSSVSLCLYRSHCLSVSIFQSPIGKCPVFERRTQRVQCPIEQRGNFHPSEQTSEQTAECPSSLSSSAPAPSPGNLVISVATGD